VRGRWHIRADPRSWSVERREALVRPELGLIQLAPRPVVEGIVHRLIPGADDGWTVAGVDEFRLQELQPEGLFVWGRRDRLVPIGFARHAPAAR
jgi:hypothetical protein